MTEEYIPSNKEVYPEIWNGFKNSFSKKNLKEFGSYAGGFGRMIATFPYILPTTIRSIKVAFDIKKEEESRGEVRKISLAQNIGGFTGFFGGIAALGAQGAGYIYFVKNGCPEMLAIPIVTNILSELYELRRNAKQRVGRKHSADISNTLDG